MKKTAILLLTILAIGLAEERAFADPGPQKYTNFSGKGTGFTLIPVNMSPSRDIYTFDYQYRKGIVVRVTVQRQKITGDTTQALLKILASNGEPANLHTNEWIDLNYNHYQLRGVAYDNQDVLEKKETFFLFPVADTMVTFNFLQLKGTSLSADDYKSRRNIFLAQYTHHIK
jgi:hypothetical protein